jgi:hypothetical protein
MNNSNEFSERELSAFGLHSFHGKKNRLPKKLTYITVTMQLEYFICLTSFNIAKTSSKEIRLDTKLIKQYFY